MMCLFGVKQIILAFALTKMTTVTNILNPFNNEVNTY